MSLDKPVSTPLHPPSLFFMGVLMPEFATLQQEESVLNNAKFSKQVEKAAQQLQKRIGGYEHNPEPSLERRAASLTSFLHSCLFNVPEETREVWRSFATSGVRLGMAIADHEKKMRWQVTDEIDGRSWTLLVAFMGGMESEMTRMGIRNSQLVALRRFYCYAAYWSERVNRDGLLDAFRMVDDDMRQAFSEMCHLVANDR